MGGNPLLNNVEQALEYRHLGFSVFPLWGGTKDKPLIQWKKYTLEKPTEDEIKDWWAKYPQANIAIITGKISGIFVLDTEKNFDLSSIEIPKETAIAETGSGGRHFYFKIPEGADIDTHIEIWGSDPKNKADIKGNGGYVVAPPSYNAEKNRHYSWLNNWSDNSAPPEWLLKLIENLKVSRQSYKFHEVSEGVQEGIRNVSASSFIGHVLLKTQQDMWETVAWPAALYWNRKNEPPLEERELRGVFESIASREFRRLKGLEEKEDLTTYEGLDKIVSSHQLREELKNLKFGDTVHIPFSPLDNLCRGFVPGELLIIASPTKQGKTTFMQFLTKEFTKIGKICLWFTFEITPRELFRRFGEDLPVFFLPKENKTNDLDWLRKRVEEAIEKYKIEVMFLDDLSYVKEMAFAKNPSIEYGYVAHYIKNIAIKYNLIIFAAHQVTEDEDIREVLTYRNLRDSKSIAHVADATIILWREILNPRRKRGEEAIYGDTKIKLSVHRRIGIVERWFKAKFIEETSDFIKIEGEKYLQSSSEISSLIKDS